MLKTKDGRELNVEELSWDEVNKILHPLLPTFTKIMESCDNDNYKFYKAKYPFGSKIISNGKCHLPLVNGDSIAFNNPSLPESLMADLDYDPATEDPLGLILSKNSEFYLQTGDRIMSHAIIHPGEMFGIPRAIEKHGSIKPSGSSLTWNLNAGARFLFTLSKVTAKNRHEKLQKNYGIRSQVPLSAEEQWPIFVEIAKAAKSPWQSEVLFFSRSWINQLKATEWAEVSNYLMQLHRASYNIWHNTALIWAAAFNEVEQQKRLTHYSMYALFTARQLFLIAANSAIGFKPATNDDSAPIKLLQEAYTNSYGLAEDNHSNVIMEPTNFGATDSNAVYYSLNYPMLAQYNPDTFKGKSLITLLDEIQHVTMAYQENILSSHTNIKSLYDVAASTNFSFYHCHSDEHTYKNILSNLLIADEDQRFTKDQVGEFPEYSAFFKGCVKISHK